MTAVLGELIWLLHLATCLFMVGVIWMVQVVHYPLFRLVGTPGFPDYAQQHQRLMTWIVGPAMLLEAGTAVALVYCRPAGIAGWGMWAGLGLIGVIWLSTACLQVPCHGVLSQGFDPQAHTRLVRSNWIRTVAWSLRGLLLLWLLWGRAAVETPTSSSARTRSEPLPERHVSEHEPARSGVLALVGEPQRLAPGQRVRHAHG